MSGLGPSPKRRGPDPVPTTACVCLRESMKSTESRPKAEAVDRELQALPSRCDAKEPSRGNHATLVLVESRPDVKLPMVLSWREDKGNSKI